MSQLELVRLWYDRGLLYVKESTEFNSLLLWYTTVIV